MVEPHVANVVVAGSSPVSCFCFYDIPLRLRRVRFISWQSKSGGIAKW